jgi:hypothetical protein
MAAALHTARASTKKKVIIMKLIAMTLASLSLLASSAAQADPRKARDDVRGVAPALEKYRQDMLFGDLFGGPGG